MKKFSLLLSAISLTLIAGCAAPPPASPPPQFATTITSEKGSDLVKIDITPTWEQASIFNAAGISGFSANFKNNTNKVMRVIWEQSSISYGGNSHTLFITGQKYMEASKPMAPTVVPALGSMNKDIFSSAQPLLATGALGGWRMRTIQADKVEIVLCIAAGDIQDYFTIQIKK
jgi:hypothetical protein